MKKKVLAFLLGIAVSMQSFSFTAAYAAAPSEMKQVTVSTDFYDVTEITLTEGEQVQLILPEDPDMPEINYIAFFSYGQKTAVSSDLMLTGLSAGEESVTVYVGYAGTEYERDIHIKADILKNESISPETRKELDRLEKLDGYYRRRMELIGALDENAPRLDMEKVTEIIASSKDYFEIFARFNEYHGIVDRHPGGGAMTTYTYWFDPKGNESVTWYLEQDLITYTKTNDNGIVEGSQLLYPEKSEFYKDGEHINYEYLDYNQINPEETDKQTPSVKGDVNGDGEFNIADVLLFQKMLLGKDVELKNYKAADLYEDDRLDSFDLCLMKRELLKK